MFSKYLLLIVNLDIPFIRNKLSLWLSYCATSTWSLLSTGERIFVLTQHLLVCIPKFQASSNYQLFTFLWKCLIFHNMHACWLSCPASAVFFGKSCPLVKITLIRLLPRGASLHSSCYNLFDLLLNSELC